MSRIAVPTVTALLAAGAERIAMVSRGGFNDVSLVDEPEHFQALYGSVSWRSDFTVGRDINRCMGRDLKSEDERIRSPKCSKVLAAGEFGFTRLHQEG